MSIKVRVPTPLRGLASGQDVLTITGDNLLQCIDSLEIQYPGFRDRLCDESGELRRFVNIYVNGEDVRFLDGITTPLKAGDEVSIVPAVAGG
ncbi:MAG: MoaD/ThiS family protein [Dehalococcoidia bacterium]|nr:MoaD/ThiS family protein [Dehalococcoidia bacterium]